MHLCKLVFRNGSNCSKSLPLAFTLICATSFAQWPTSYQSPMILGGGTNTRAGAIKANASGGVYVAFDNFQAATRQLKVGKYNAAGEQLFTDIFLAGEPSVAILLKILTSPAGTEFGLLSQFAKSAPGSLEATYMYQLVSAQGHWTIAKLYNKWIPFDGVNYSGSKFAFFMETPSINKFTIAVDESDISSGDDLEPDTHIEDAELFTIPNDNILGIYTKVAVQPDTPGEIWCALLQPQVPPPFLSAPKKVDDSPDTDQSKPHITELVGSSNLMLTWLGEIDGNIELYAAVADSFGNVISSARNCLPDVVDYVPTSSTLGLPVFAAVQRNSEFPLVESLVGGLVNPSNGGTLTIPISSVPGVKVKALRQEANGDFSLVYSIPENGTNLLKVRRISGTSAATLWETTVADLGWANDEVIDRHPNTWVTGNQDSVLYILARYDEPNTANSSFQLVRLRADGVLGAD